jgi:hypothetical protein
MCVRTRRGGRSIECKRCREFPVRLDLLLQIGDFLFCCSNRIGAGDEAARRGLLARDGD